MQSLGNHQKINGFHKMMLNDYFITDKTQIKNHPLDYGTKIIRNEKEVYA
jgi:hypothetical protein